MDRGPKGEKKRAAFKKRKRFGKGKERKKAKMHYEIFVVDPSRLFSEFIYGVISGLIFFGLDLCVEKRLL